MWNPLRRNRHTGARAAAARGLTIRSATQADAAAVRRVAALDERPVPPGELVLAEVAGEVVAALPLAGGAPVADPFRPTADLLPLLELRARQLRATGAPADERAGTAVWSPRLAR